MILFGMKSSASRGADFTESFGDTLRRRRTRIHPLQIGAQLRKVVDQVELVGPIDKVRGDAIRNCDATAKDEPTPFKMGVDDRSHRKKLFSRGYNVCLQTLVLRIKRRVLADPPEWLLELCDCKHDPAIGLRPLPQVSGQQPLLAIFVGEVKHDRRRFRNNEVAVDQHGNLPRRIEAQEIRTLMLVSQQIDRNKFKIRVEFLESPERSQ